MALIDKASLLMVPSTYEAGKLYNVLPSGNRAPDSTGANSGYDQTRADFDFDRGSNTAATRVNADGLIEKYRENLLLHSNQFDTTWSKTNTTLTSGQEGYDSSNDAWLLDKSADFGRITQSVTNNGVQTFSVYAKAGTLNYMRLRVLGTFNAACFFDFTDGSVSNNDGFAASIVSVGGGWYRCSYTFDSNITEVQIFPANSGSSVSGGSGSIYIQNAQVESGMVSTDYLESTSVTGKAGVLIDLPRIDYSSGAGALLLEPSRQQLFQYSEYLEHSSWTKSNVTTTSNAAISPEGVQNASKIIGTTSSNFTRAIVSVSAGDITMSAWVKSVDGSDIEFQMGAGSLGASNVGTFTATSEWQRFDKVINIATAITSDFGFFNKSGNQLNLYVYGAQLEAGSYSTSYIPNHGESGGVTRAADSCSVTGVSDVIGQTEGTFFFEIGEKTTESIGIFEAGQGSSQHRFLVYVDASNKLKILVVTNYAVQVSYTSSVNVESNAKIAIAYKTNDYAIYLNGSQLSTDTSASVPPMTQLAIGSDRSAIVTATNNIKQAALFNERLTNEELATLTTL
jgi:hypothetical protein